VGFFDSMASAWTPKEVGEKVRGVITDSFEKQQTGGDVQLVNGKPQFVPNDTLKEFKNGQKAMALVVVLRVAEETLEDNGLRSVYINRPSRLFTAVASALKAAGSKEPAVGDTLEVEFTGFDPESMNGKARTYAALYVVGNSALANEVEQTAAPVTQSKDEVSAEAAELLKKLAALGVK